MALSEKLVLPKVFLQAHELMLNAFAFDLKGKFLSNGEPYKNKTLGVTASDLGLRSISRPFYDQFKYR